MEYRARWYYIRKELGGVEADAVRARHCAIGIRIFETNCFIELKMTVRQLFAFESHFIQQNTL